MIENHLLSLSRAMEHTRPQLNTIRSWGHMLAGRLGSGGRLLVCGNGGSAAEAQHLTAELVGRFRDERQPLSAIALHAETSSLTAIVNDYGMKRYSRAAYARTGVTAMSYWRCRPAGPAGMSLRQ
ncbi:phosphoheptose isomerase [Mycobacteroides abscessus]|nr:phosphoheptose isomerase [Mycobacteroides abscessus]